MAEQRRKQLELDVINASKEEGPETATACMPKQSKDAAKQAFNTLIKKVETMQRPRSKNSMISTSRKFEGDVQHHGVLCDGSTVTGELKGN